MSELTPDLEAELFDLIRQCRTIEAIKRHREATGSSLADSKNWVDELLQRGVVRSVPRAARPCPYCGKPLRTDQAKQCFGCGMDWHAPERIVQRGQGV